MFSESTYIDSASYILEYQHREKAKCLKFENDESMLCICVLYRSVETSIDRGVALMLSKGIYILAQKPTTYAIY